MENPFNRPSCSHQEPGRDSVFKVPRPVVKFGANRLLNSQLQNGSELSYRMNRGSESFNTSRNTSRFQLQLNRGNELGESSRLGRSISSNTSETSLFKIPKLDAQYRKNELQPMSFAAERAASTSASESHLQLDTRKSAMFSTGFSSSRSSDLVRRGVFNTSVSLFNKGISQNSVLQNSSRLPINMTSNADDNLSIAGSAVSMMSNISTVAITAQLINIFESLENTLVKNQPSFTPEELKAVLRKAKEVAINTVENEQSKAMSIRDVDATSVLSESAKSLYSTFSKARTHSNVKAVKSHREILAELQLNQQGITSEQNSQVQFFTSFETSRRNVERTVDHMSTIHENVEDDRTVIFNNDKGLKINTKRKAITEKPAEKEVMREVNKNAKPKQAANVITLRKWFPVAANGNLIFNGVTDNNDCIETKAIKKRINNRRVELVDGKICEILGSPSSSVVSAFPKGIIQKLKDGLHIHWKVLQRDLANCQKNFNSKPVKNKKNVETRDMQVVEYTPRTRKVVCEEESLSSHLNLSTPLRRKETEGKKNGVVRREPVVVLERSDLSIVKPNKGSKEGEKRVGRQGKKIVEAPGSEKKKNNIEEPVVRTRTGRVVKPLGDLWKDGSFIFNFKKKDNNRNDSSLVPQKRKLEENRSQAQVKRPKIKRASLEKENKKGSPELDSSNSSVPSPKKKGTPLPKSLVDGKKSKGASKAGKNRKNVKAKNIEDKKKEVEKQKTQKNSKPAAVSKEYNDSFEYSLGDIVIPDVEPHNSKTQLSKSQIRAINMETPPLKYFTGNLHLSNTVTPDQSPNWQLSQRTESEVKRFQTRREKTFKQKIPAKKAQEVSKTRRSPRNKDLDNVMDWIADKDVKSPKKRSKLINLVIPSRKQEEEDDDDESDDGDSDA